LMHASNQSGTRRWPSGAIECHHKRSTVSSASWPSGSPGTIYDNDTDSMRFLGARVQSIAELRYQYYSSHYDYLPVQR
jgi:hypothetical protein